MCLVVGLRHANTEMDVLFYSGLIAAYRFFLWKILSYLLPRNYHYNAISSQ